MKQRIYLSNKPLATGDEVLVDGQQAKVTGYAGRYRRFWQYFVKVVEIAQ